MVLSLKVNAICHSKRIPIFRCSAISEKNKNSITNIIRIATSFQKIVHQSGPAASASYSLIGSILVFTFIGNYIDAKYESSPIFILSGLSLGLIVGFYGLIKIFYLQQKQNKKNF